MPPEKRKADEAVNQSRKSARVLQTPNRYGHTSKALPPRKLQYEGRSCTAAETLSMGHVEMTFRDYDRILPFISPSLANDHYVLVRHKGIEKATRAIFEIHLDALDKIEILCDRIQWHTVYQNPALWLATWYWNSDIFDLGPGHIQEMFMRFPASDTSDLRRYLMEIMSGRLHQRTIYNDRCETLKSVMELMRVFEFSRDRKSHLNRFQFAISVLAELFRSKDPMNIFQKLLLEVRPYLDTDDETYLDCANARRTLWSSYASILPESLNEPEPDEHKYNDTCVHAQVLPLIEQLQEKAQHEIRRNTYLAVGQNLPVELVDLIEESGDLVEGVPLNLETSREVEVVYQPKEHWPKRLIKTRKVLDEYACHRMIYD